jgi:hypothetical protein
MARQVDERHLSLEKRGRAGGLLQKGDHSGAVIGRTRATKPRQVKSSEMERGGKREILMI